ncbi:MAG: TldD/PmbA family protein [Deltaproteobacteria bacterium]|nr:TldD/PmbA family protein [Deltaproteobacteria bacterium]MBI3388667.1 TldD/PmbA family protein [Deltaproteobacteria bacterium]
MSAQALEDIAEVLLTAAKRHGATSADVVVAEGDSLSVGVRLGEIEKIKRARAKHLGLRVFVGQSTAISATADFSRDSLTQLAEETCALARVTAPDPFGGLPPAEDLARAIPDLDLYDPDAETVTPEHGIELARRAEDAARGADPRITNSEGAEFGAGHDRVLYASSTGFVGGYRDSGFSLSAVPIATENGSMQRDYWYSSHRKLAALESPEAIGRKAAARTVRRLGARQVPTCEVPVVFDPETAGSLLRHLAGAVSGYSLYKGSSFLIGKLGERIAPEFLTVYDDGTLVGGLGSKPFDGEGLATRRNTIIDRGVLTSYLFDTYSARKLSSRSTGSASRSIGDAPHVGTTNMFPVAGTLSAAEIIRSVPAGLYVTELIGMGVNPVTGDYSRGVVGQWIVNGELAYAVEEITIAGNLLEMFRTIECLGSDLDLRHSVSAPTIKIARMTVAGT